MYTFSRKLEGFWILFDESFFPCLFRFLFVIANSSSSFYLLEPKTRVFVLELVVITKMNRIDRFNRLDRKLKLCQVGKTLKTAGLISNRSRSGPVFYWTVVNVHTVVSCALIKHYNSDTLMSLMFLYTPH